ncbi:MAG: hypothetical protein PUC28_07795 [Blautia sp.]|nr:hypothetical protein [Blautia sp.]
MKVKNWMKYLSMMMSLVLLMTMVPSATAFAAEDGSGKIVLTSFEKLEKPEKDHFEQGTEEKDLSLPEKIKAYDAEGTEYELTELKWTIRPVKTEDGKEDMDAEPVKYDPLVTEPGEYIFTLKLSDEYEFVPAEDSEEKELPKVDLTIDPKEEVTEAPTEEVTEPATEAPIEEATDPATEVPTEEVTEPATEALDTEETPASDLGALNDAPMVSLVLPEKMEVGKAYQLQYKISNEELAAAGESSVSYSVQDGSEFVDMPDQSGNFTVLGAGTVAFQVNVVLANGTELQAYAQGETIPAEAAETPATEVPDEQDPSIADDPTALPMDGNDQRPVAEDPATPENPTTPAAPENPAAPTTPAAPENSAAPTTPEAPTTPTTPETHWYDGMTLAISTPGSGEGSLAVGTDYPLGYTLTAADGSAVLQDQIPQGVSAVYSVSDTNLAEIVKAEDGSQLLRVKEAGSFTVQVSLDGLTSAAVSYTSARSSAAELLSFAVADISAVPENGEIHITLPCNSALDVANITPVITVSEKASVSPASGTVMDFSDGAAKTITVTAEDGVTVKTYQVTVTKAAHSFGDWSVTKEATCTEAGEESRTCSVCGTVETKEIPAKGHTVGKEWVTIKKATCTKEGKKVQKCTVCGEVVNTKIIKALGHEWETITKEPTCTEAGEEYKKCTRCSEIKDKKTLEALGHDWSDWKTTVQPTTTSKGKQERTCKRCGTTETKEIQRLNIIGNASNNYIWGFTNPAKYPVNSVITFEAIGDGTDNEEPISGDVRYVPTSTWNLVNDYKWGNNGYTASFRITKAGNYTLKVTFMKQVYDGSNWVDSGETVVSTQDFTIAGEGQFTDENGNGTGNTKNPDEVIGGGVKTGDDSPIAVLVTVLVIAAALLIILGVYRKKKNK